MANLVDRMFCRLPQQFGCMLLQVLLAYLKICMLTKDLFICLLDLSVINYSHPRTLLFVWGSAIIWNRGEEEGWSTNSSRWQGVWVYTVSWEWHQGILQETHELFPFPKSLHFCVFVGQIFFIERQCHSCHFNPMAFYCKSSFPVPFHNNCDLGFVMKILSADFK